jgi:hypothetical protein
MIVIYLSGRIHNASDEEIHGWREAVKKCYPQWSYLDPSRHRFTGSNDVSKQLSSEEKAIVQQDLHDIKASDVLLGHIQEYSAATMMEIFAAKTQGRLVVLVMKEEFFHDLWLKYHSDCMTTSFENAFSFIHYQWLKSIEG